MINIPDSVKKNLPKDFNINDIGRIDLREAEKIASEDILFLNEKDLAEGLEDFDLIPLKDAQGDERELSIRTVEPKVSLEPEIEVTAPPEDTFDKTADSEKGSRKQGESAGIRSSTHARTTEGYVEGDDEYVIWDMPESDGGRAMSKITKSFVIDKTQPAAEEIVKAEAVETEQSSETAAAPKAARDEDEVIISIEDLGEKTQPLRAAATEELAPLEEKDAVRPAAERHATAPAALYDRERNERMIMLHEDDDHVDVSAGGEVFFIDDKLHGVQDDRADLFDESGLDRIVSGIVQIDEGSSYVLFESDVAEDRKRIAVIADEFRPAYEDLFIDLDYKYGDEELDYIHTAIVEEDYSSYIREIDEFFSTRGGKTVPAATELLGLTADEFDTIEDLLFKGEFKDIRIYDRYHLYEFDRSSREGSPRERKNCRYFLPDENSLVDFERDSIESDISSDSALIFEEDVEDIKEKLRSRTGKTDEEAIEMIERAVRKEIVRREAKSETGHKKISEITPREDAPAAKTTASEGLFDITDRVVILNDEADVERFINEFPPRKQVNIKMLLKYLDGLFERLPEEIIKKFASSEYFDLYLKVLNELGV